MDDMGSGIWILDSGFLFIKCVMKSAKRSQFSMINYRHSILDTCTCIVMSSHGMMLGRTVLFTKNKGAWNSGIVFINSIKKKL